MIESSTTTTLHGADCSSRSNSSNEDALCVESVAKHVETDALANKLQELGVGYAQGHRLHVAEPLTRLMDTYLLS
jgi:EAL domain-containing protein (putative c-di-GMP-specific phosphodiesterase class I)